MSSEESMLRAGPPRRGQLSRRARAGSEASCSDDASVTSDSEPSFASPAHPAPATTLVCSA
eukprot:1018079-Rhodomonas_salina.1